MSTFEDANCAGKDTETFFPSEHDQAGMKAARAICSGCPLGLECLEFALDAELKGKQQRHGIYGGLSPRQRGDIARARAKEAAA